MSLFTVSLPLNAEDTYEKHMKLDGQKYLLKIMDTAGQVTNFPYVFHTPNACSMYIWLWTLDSCNHVVVDGVC